MSFPNPIQQSDAFIAYLRAENLDFCVRLFERYQTRPDNLSDGRLDEANLSKWCEEMYGLLVCIFHYLLPQADHSAIF